MGDTLLRAPASSLASANPVGGRRGHSRRQTRRSWAHARRARTAADGTRKTRGRQTRERPEACAACRSRRGREEPIRRGAAAGLACNWPARPLRRRRSKANAGQVLPRAPGLTAAARLGGRRRRGARACWRRAPGSRSLQCGKTAGDAAARTRVAPVHRGRPPPSGSHPHDTVNFAVLIPCNPYLVPTRPSRDRPGPFFVVFLLEVMLDTEDSGPRAAARGRGACRPLPTLSGGGGPAAGALPCPGHAPCALRCSPGSSACPTSPRPGWGGRPSDGAPAPAGGAASAAANSIQCAARDAAAGAPCARRRGRAATTARPGVFPLCAGCVSCSCLPATAEAAWNATQVPPTQWPGGVRRGTRQLKSPAAHPPARRCPPPRPCACGRPRWRAPSRRRRPRLEGPDHMRPAPRGHKARPAQCKAGRYMGLVAIPCGARKPLGSRWDAARAGGAQPVGKPATRRAGAPCDGAALAGQLAPRCWGWCVAAQSRASWGVLPRAGRPRPGSRAPGGESLGFGSGDCLEGNGAPWSAPGGQHPWPLAAPVGMPADGVEWSAAAQSGDLQRINRLSPALSLSHTGWYLEPPSAGMPCWCCACSIACCWW